MSLVGELSQLSKRESFCRSDHKAMNSQTQSADRPTVKPQISAKKPVVKTGNNSVNKALNQCRKSEEYPFVW